MMVLIDCTNSSTVRLSAIVFRISGGSDVWRRKVATVDVPGRGKHESDCSVGDVLSLRLEGAAGVIMTRAFADCIGGVMGGIESGIDGVSEISRLSTPCTKPERITN